MIGCEVHDLKKNTATCGAVNDRLRRRTKRIEKESIRKSVKDGTFFSSLNRKV
jgi:hypothetical protein